MPLRNFLPFALVFSLAACGDSDSSDATEEPLPNPTTDMSTIEDAATAVEDATITSQDAGMVEDAASSVDAMAPLPVGDPIALDDAATELTEAVCAFSERCDLLELLELVVNEPCDVFIKAQFEEGTLAATQAARDAGRINYSENAMARCVAELGASDCSADLESLFAVCDDAFEGQVDLGDACEASNECLGTAACRFNNACPGSCGALPMAGEACDAQAGCATDSVCVEDLCVTPIGLNGACSENSAPCEAGLFCKTNLLFMTSACEPLNTNPVGEGATCDLNGGPFCSTGLSCVAQPPAFVIPNLPAIPEFKCLPKVSASDICFAGAPDQCPSGYFCDGFDLEDLENLDIEGTCVALPNEGEPCATSLVGEICNVGLVCNGTTCASRVRNGSNCTADTECYGGSCTDGVCGPIQPEACR